jgi:hypothetical protein
MRRAAVSDGLAAILVRCGAAGDVASPDARHAVAGFARRAQHRGVTPATLPAAVRRSLAGAVPPTRRVAAFESIAHRLVRHATCALLDD